jgi:hypothetical protein
VLTEREVDVSDIEVEPGPLAQGAQRGPQLAVIVELMRRNQKC